MTTKQFARLSVVLTIAALVFSAFHANATTYYVNSVKGSSDSYGGLDWFHPKATIQGAISAASNGDLVLVTNGTYSLNGAMTGSISNRVAITNAITVQSVNGPRVTFITGLPANTGTGLGTGAVRCAYVAAGAYLSGFTLTNGATLDSTGPSILERNGGGVYCEDGGAVLNCIITGNTGQSTGGIYGGAIHNCIITNNHPTTVNTVYDQPGVGAAVNAALYNCLVISNRGGLCSACYEGSLFNCTVVGNISTNYAVLNSSVDNSIVYYNTGSNRQIETNNFSLSYTHNCSPQALPGIGNTTNPPIFVSLTTPDFHLGPGSPCVDTAGPVASNDTDLDGMPRAFRTPDMGCYERQIPGDINNDGRVDANDLKTLLANYSSQVDQQAVSLVLSNYWPNQLLLNMTNVAGLGTSNVTFALTNSNAGAYTVQSSTDLNTWQSLGAAKPAYNFTDTNAPTGTRYYRLVFP